ncbi:SPOR domain-containing protein [Pedobacter panaciterrae]|jgi:Sporulation related domain.|uniref:SPOR domain-containing protein n=1 Tax=Pedobacter panaciterrae TaxID=363849 RepID=UPI00155DAC29|nr:SPOR domain-containing protein [Pedobacter panaciterrae]NQX54958.1 SPOR domain-containing protein [Pedobacter panaciterrae]
MKLLFAALFCCSYFGLFAQTRGQVTIIKDPMIDSLIAKRIALNTKQPGTGTVPYKPGPVVSQMGYRVQAFYGSDRRQVFNEQSRFNSLYPAVNTYITYKEPNYYLRVGDFRTRLEAQRFMNELRSNFPTLFIFREKINAPNLEYNDDPER